MAGIALAGLGALAPLIGRAAGSFILPRVLPTVGNLVSKIPLSSMGTLSNNLLRFGGNPLAQSIAKKAGQIGGFGLGTAGAVFGSELYSRSQARKNMIQSESINGRVFDPRDLSAMSALNSVYRNMPFENNLGGISRMEKTKMAQNNLNYLSALRDIYNRRLEDQREQSTLETVAREMGQQQ
jgi:hypothetical protein